MNMEVILTENIKNKGYIGDIIKVKLGYARNFLFPKGVAVPKNNETIKLLKSLEKKRVVAIAKEKDDYQIIANHLNNQTITLIEKIHDENKLYGSISSLDIVSRIKENFNVEIERKKIKMPANQDSIKMMGNYEILIQLHSEIACTINLIIKPEQEPDKKDLRRKMVPKKQEEKSEEKEESSETAQELNQPVGASE